MSRCVENGRAPFVAAAVGIALLAACSASPGSDHTTSATSCADVLTLNGVTYVGGRGDEASPWIPTTGKPLTAEAPTCDDGAGPSEGHTEAVLAIKDVSIADAVVATRSPHVMVSDALWTKDIRDLPAALQRYLDH